MSRKLTYAELEQRLKVAEEKLEKQSRLKKTKPGSGRENEISSGTKISVSGITVEWDLENGACTFETLPVAMMWVDTTLAGLMSGVQSMVGMERFALALQAQGRESVEEDWRAISQFSDFREGFKAIANIAAVAGWGEWRLISLNKKKKECRFRIKGSWEGKYQKSLGICWGSGMLAGKLAGYASRLFSTNCWADQTAYIAKGDEFDEFLVKPSERTIEKEIEDLLLTDEATKADMAVALQKLQKEIAERKRVEKALRESEEKYRILVENANDAIFVAQDEVIKFPNPKAEELSGYSKEELARIPFTYLVHPDDKELVLERYRKRLSGEELPSTYSFRITNKTGRELWVQLNTVFISWEGRPASLTFLRDVTQHRKLESQIRYAQRMESLGTLAGGIAHDFNNLLTGIQGNVSLMLIEKDPNDPDHEKLKNIEKYVQNGADLTKQLLGFARGGKYEVKATDLNSLIETNSQLFGRTRKEIRIFRKYQKDIWAVEVDRGQMNQVLLNIYVNAWQAMPGGGKLYLQTENVTFNEQRVKPFQVEPGRYVKIYIRDTGVGMDEATQQRIFEPFFTSKKIGRGTGLGLASVYGIVKNHGGFITVLSKKGEGTTLKIYLPASEAPVLEEPETSSGVLKGEGTILLVDDEEMIIKVGRKQLELLGYSVMVAKNGNEAIGLYEKHQEEIDMVILDMIMPGMGGGQTYDHLKEINPDVAVLLSSGYSIDGQAREILNRGCTGFIQKPFNIEGISLKVREILLKK